MTRWLILMLIVLANLAGAFFALAPGLIPYAEIVPPSVDCALRSSPDVQQALIKAASIGRHQAISLVQTYTWVMLLVCATNIIFVAVVLFAPALTLRSRGTPQKRGAP